MKMYEPEFVEFELTKGCKKPHVNNWINDSYEYPKFIALKDKLNKKKSEIDKLDQSKYVNIASATYVMEDARGDYGRLAEEFDAQIVTKAWMKLFELTHRYVKDYITEEFYSFHVAEAPGAFLPSLNHYFRTQCHGVDWTWYAESYRDPVTRIKTKQKGKFLSDTYGLMKKYPEHWIFGANDDGDITRGANWRWFKNELTALTPRRDLYTSDVKFVPDTPDFTYDEEEFYNIPVHVGHTFGALLTLSKGGMAILKTFTFFEAQSISLLFLLTCFFEKVFITKPIASTPANSETYVICINYNNRMTDNQRTILYEYLEMCRTAKNKKETPVLFAKKDIPKEFVDQIYDFEVKMTDRQIKYIDRNLELYKKYKNTKKVKQNIDKKDVELRDKFASYWIENYNVEKINRKYWL